MEWIGWKKNWKGIGSIGMAKRSVSDLEGKAAAARGHWGIEAVHWCPDAALNEDKRIVRKDNGAQNPAVLKRMALNIIGPDKSLGKAAGPKKRFRACWDTNYLETVLRQV